MTNDNAAFAELPLGAIRPTGWLLDQLRLQAAGQTGRLDEIWPDVGPNSAWLGGDGEGWERGPYYLDGLLPLAYLLDDAELLAKAQKWIEAILGSQRPDGQFGPKGTDDWWPRMVAMKALTQYADATDDQRVAPFLERYFRFQAATLPQRPLRGWGRARGADNVLSILWLYQRTGQAWLRDLARMTLDQTADWTRLLTDDLPAGPTRTFRHGTHGPNVAMGLKKPAVGYLVDGSPQHRADTRRMFAHLDRLHGLVHGVFSGDEWLAGREPHHGVETCQVVELMFTLEQVARVFGEGWYGDQLELVAFNLLPASNDARMLAHQYHQQANQVLVSYAARDWTFSGDSANVFGLEPHYGCCTANLHQGWPKLVRSLWMQADDGALAAVAYAPCTVDATVAGRAVRLDVRTSYPFEETVRIVVDVEEPTRIPLRLRVPQWCANPALRVGDEDIPVHRDERGYATITRRWQAGDTVTLTLPMRVRTVPRDNGAVGVRLGPLVLALAVGEVWRPIPDSPPLAEWEITPCTSWNFGLRLDAAAGNEQAWPVRRRPVPAVPFTAKNAAVIVEAQGAPIPEWQLAGNSAASPPPSPVPPRLPAHTLKLLPYGCARLRVAELPVFAPATDADEDTDD